MLLAIDVGNSNTLCGLYERGGPRPPDHRLAEMADVEEADALTYRGVLLDDAATGILDRHLPATEVGHLRAQRDMSVVKWRSAQVGHAPGR